MARLIETLRKKEAHKWFWLSVAALLVGLFFLLSTQLPTTPDGRSEFITAMDEFAWSRLFALRTVSLTNVAVDVTALGSFTVLSLLTGLFFTHFWLTRQNVLALQVLIAGGGSGILTYCLKTLFQRARPSLALRLVNADGFSYPSGHSLSAAAVYVTLTIVLVQRARTRAEKFLAVGFFAGLISAIGCSRIYLGAHYFSDVTAGFMLGTAWASLIAAAMLFYGDRVAAKLPSA